MADNKLFDDFDMPDVSDIVEQIEKEEQEKISVSENKENIKDDDAKMNTDTKSDIGYKDDNKNDNSEDEADDDNDSEDDNDTMAFEGLSTEKIDEVLSNVDDIYKENIRKAIVEEGDLDTFSLDTMSNLSVEDTIKFATSKKTFDRTQIVNLTEEDLLKIKKDDPIYSHLTQDQRDFILTEEQKEFAMKSFGKDILGYMNKKGVVEISLEQDGYIWIEEFGMPERYNTGIRLSQTDSARIIQLISTYNGERISRDNPKLDGVTPNGMRFSAIMYDAVGFKNVFSIRKPSGVVIPLSQYVDRGVMTSQQVDFISKQILAKKNIVFSGGTSSGKTTSINSFNEVLANCPDKIITIEDVPELMISSKIWTRLIANRYISTMGLLRQCMRLSPDRIMIGEIRTGDVTLEYLKASNSGHSGGITSIHANNAYGTILKLEQYLSEVLTGEYWRLITTAVDMIINVGINPVTHERPMVKEIAVLKGFDKKTGDYILEDAMTGKRIDVVYQ